MSNLVNELLLRLLKPLVGVLLGALVLLVAVGLGAEPSIELVLLAWLSGVAFILLVQETAL